MNVRALCLNKVLLEFISETMLLKRDKLLKTAIQPSRDSKQILSKSHKTLFFDLGLPFNRIE